MAFSGDREAHYEHDVLAQARRAARRAGMSLSEWLDNVVESERSGGRDRRRGAAEADPVAAIQAKLDAFERRQERADPLLSESYSSRDILRRLEDRLDAIAKRTAPRRPQEEAGPPVYQAEPFAPYRNPAETAGRDSRLGGEPVADLRDAIAEISARQQTLERDFDKALAGHADRIDHRLDAVTERLEQSIERTSPQSAIRDLEAEIRAIAARLDHQRAEPAGDLRAEFSELVRRLDEIPPRLAEEMAARLEDTARRLDTATRSELDSIRAEMREIAQEIDRATRSGFESVHAELAKLMTRFEESDTAGRAAPGAGLDDADRAELAAIREEIRALAGHIDDSQRGERDALHAQLQGISERLHTREPEGYPDIERHLDALADRINSDRPEGRDAGLAEIEKQIARLAERVEQTSDRSDELASLNQRIGDLFGYLEENHATAGVVATLREELTTLKLNVDQADQRNQSTLEAVHQTLNKIVDRLADLEEEVEDVAEGSRHPHYAPAAPMAEDGRSEPVAAPEPEIATDDIVDRIEAVSRSFRAEADDHTPLAPGSGPPRAEPSLDPAADAESAKKTDRESFIAAARRAAQAAAAEPAIAADERVEPKSSRLAGLAKTYRRPLLIALAMVILVLGAMKAAEFLSARGGAGASIGTSGEAVGAIVEDDAAAQTAQADNSAAEAETAVPAPRIVGGSAGNGSRITTGSIASESAPAAPKAAGTQATDKPAAAAETETSVAARSAPAIETPPAGIGSERLRQAAVEGDPRAQFEIGARYMDGHGIAQDFGKAAYWYRLAAAQGLAPAQYRLGSLYEKGHGVSRDVAMARTWYQRAAEQGNRTAMHNLAVLHADGAEGEPNYEQAALWFRQASEYGLQDSQYNLAVLHARGLGVEQDLAESYRWFAAAAEQGDAEAAVQRDEIASRLDSDTLSAIRLVAQSWQAKSLIREANTVEQPEGGWDPQPVQTAAAPESGPALVREVQTLLDRLGYSPGPVDGQFGAMTRQAVIEFQRSTGLPETGEVTPELLSKLTQASG